MNMEEERKRIYTIVAVVAAVGLVLSCVAGALAGGLTGFLIGQRQARVVAERTLGGALEELRQFAMPMPMPEPDQGGVIPMPPFEGFPSGVQGAMVLDVVSGTPAAEAGLAEGDLIAGVDNVPVDQNHQLAEVIGQYQPGDRVTLHFWRAGQEQSVQVTLTANPDGSGRAYLGVYFQMFPGMDLQLPQE
jgi:hypothetical protein